MLFRSDQTVSEQGISRSGNRRVRALSIELAWAWLRYQPTSALSQWFEQRFGEHGRARRIGIVALARKLLIAFWRYVDQGVLPGRGADEELTDSSIRKWIEIRSWCAPLGAGPGIHWMTGVAEGAARPCSRPACDTHKG